MAELLSTGMKLIVSIFCLVSRRSNKLNQRKLLCAMKIWEKIDDNAHYNINLHTNHSIPGKSIEKRPNLEATMKFQPIGTCCAFGQWTLDRYVMLVCIRVAF